MSEVAVDFGTCNTALARHNETTGRVETIEIPGISAWMRYRLTPDGEEFAVPVVPSIIHYSETETLIGDQVISRGLAEHPHTIRWIKRSIAMGATRRRKTAQGHKSPAEAGEDFLSLLLRYASDQISPAADAFTFTAPVEAFENFQDWLFRVCESVGIQRVKLLDEPTACIFGYHGASHRDDRFVVVDFGGGTLDVSAVRIEPAPGEGRKAVQLGKAGCDLGGADIDQWLTADLCNRYGLENFERRELESVILRRAEDVKIQLSDPTVDEADLSVMNDLGAAPRMLLTTYTRSCPACERGHTNGQKDPGAGCLGCLFLANDFLRKVRETLDRAMENAAVKVGMRRDNVTRVLVTGGTGLIPAVRSLLKETFGDRVVFDHPFDSVVRGACQGVVEPVLQHEYAIESYNRGRGEYEFKPLFSTGTEYPTRPEAIRFWSNGSRDGMTRIGIEIFEVSRLKRRNPGVSIVDAEGVLREDSRVASEFQYISLNRENPTFIVADPPVNLERDKKRFLCSFMIDGNRRLLVTVLDNLKGVPLLKDHPVVRL